MTNERTQDMLSAEEAEFFHRDGYLVLESILEPADNERLMREVDDLVEHRGNNDHRLLVGYPEMGMLTSYPAVIDRLEILLGPRFAMHHIHSARHDAGDGGVHWHQDYEQLPQTNRSHIMVHVFYYMNGLNGEIGDLLLVPKSQNIVIQNGGLGGFGSEDLPGSLCLDSLPPGSAVIVHSALWHARRPKPGGEGRPRYFIDVSYCQNGVRWPSYLDLSSMDKINRTALDRGCGRAGRYDYLYDTSQFFDQVQYREHFKESMQGSIVLDLKAGPDGA